MDLPSYDGRGLVNLIAELEARLGGRAPAARLESGLAELIPPASTYVLVLLDGLGDGQLSHRTLEALPAARVARLEAGFCTTTTTSLATVSTGLPPSQHGLLGHLLWLPEVGRVVNTLKWVDLTGATVNYQTAALLPPPNLWERLSAAGIEAIPASVYVAAEMTAPGCVKHTARGDLVIGDLSGLQGTDESRRHQLGRLATLFGRAGISCTVSENIAGELWTKLIMNCAYNAISALSRSRYGRMVRSPWTRELMRQVIEEVVAVGRAAGVQFPSVNLVEAGLTLAETMPNAISSTAQDLARGKRTEIDSLNGYVARRGAELGVATPVNQTLHALVKLLEEAA